MPALNVVIPFGCSGIAPAVRLLGGFDECRCVDGCRKLDCTGTGPAVVPFPECGSLPVDYDSIARMLKDRSRVRELYVLTASSLMAVELLSVGARPVIALKKGDISRMRSCVPEYTVLKEDRHFALVEPKTELPLVSDLLECTC